MAGRAHSKGSLAALLTGSALANSGICPSSTAELTHRAAPMQGENAKTSARARWHASAGTATFMIFFFLPGDFKRESSE